MPLLLLTAPATSFLVAKHDPASSFHHLLSFLAALVVHQGLVSWKARDPSSKCIDIMKAKKLASSLLTIQSISFQLDDWIWQLAQQLVDESPPQNLQGTFISLAQMADTVGYTFQLTTHSALEQALWAHLVFCREAFAELNVQLCYWVLCVDLLGLTLVDSVTLNQWLPSQLPTIKVTVPHQQPLATLKKRMSIKDKPCSFLT